MIELYEPVNTLKPVGENIWIVDGPLVWMSLYGGKFPFTTRMVIIRLEGGALFIWSPTELSPELTSQIDALGSVKFLISPNKIHYAHIATWKEAYPGAAAWASPGVEARAKSQNIPVLFDDHLQDASDPAWTDEIDQLIFRGNRFMEEVIFFHKSSRTLILADFIENFELKKMPPLARWLARLSGAVDPDGKAPLDLRLLFWGHKSEARKSFRRMIAWAPERVIMAHGRWYQRDGVAELTRAFRWLGARR